MSVTWTCRWNACTVPQNPGQYQVVPGMPNFQEKLFQSSKLKTQIFSLKRGKRDVRALCLKLRNSVWKWHSKWDKLYLLHRVLRCSSPDAVDLPLVCCLNLLYTSYTLAPSAGRHCLTHSQGATPLPTFNHVSCLRLVSLIQVICFCYLKQ